jgi:2,4-dienoyl-CoA reductase-like NADH-dependent reductase (Old Yellow Enzyme family)
MEIMTVIAGEIGNGYTRSMAMSAVASGAADMVAFGRPFISNPDLVDRLRLDEPLAVPNAATLYCGAAVGYTDYPALHPSDPSSAASDKARAIPAAV